MTFRKSFLRLAATAACALFASSLHAQVVATAPTVSGTTEMERFDILGGAAYSHFNPGFAHQVQGVNLVGWQGAGTAWFSNLFGVEASFRGLYGTYNLPVNGYPTLPSTSAMSEYLFLFGPSFRLYQSPRYTAGMHVLVGGANGTFDKGYNGILPAQIGVYDSQLATAYAIGGWGDYKIDSRFAVRFTGDYQPTRYSGIGQNEFAGGIGIVYEMGRRK